MKNLSFGIYVFCLFGCYVTLHAQTVSIILWPDGIPGEIKASVNEKEEYKDGELQRVSSVTHPTLTVYQPTSNANGIAVLVIPGGGYAHLSINKEGKQVAQWLNTQGITAFVLKYRLPDDKTMADKSIGPLQDAQEALRIIRRNAKQWNVNPDKIGVAGFSAGGHLAALLANHYMDESYKSKDNISARPDFCLLLYPVISMKNEIAHKGSQRNLLGENPSEEAISRFSNELHVTDSTPPTFIIHAADDKSVPVEHSLLYFSALKKSGVSAEIHVFETGGHGFGLGDESKNTYWPVLWIKWLEISMKSTTKK